MSPWWLALGYPSLLVNSPFRRLRRILQAEGRWERMAAEEGDRRWVSEHRDRRKQAIHDFLADPGYCDAATIRRVRQLAPDLFSERQCDHYLAEPWPLHLRLLGRDTLFHVLTAASGIASFVLLGVHLALPGLICALLWLLLLPIEWVRPVVTGITRQLLLTPDWPELDRALLTRWFIASLPWWQKPVGWVVVPLTFPAVLRWRRRLPVPSVKAG
jgi:hypothetical protein